MKLHPIINDIKTTLWCGPGALSTITGKPVSECMTALRDSTWRTTPIKGVSTGHLVKAAARLGVKLTEIKVPYTGRLTMAAWTRENAATFAQTPVVLVVAHHYVTIKGRSFNDNHCMTPMPLKKARLRRARVVAAYQAQEMTPDATPPVAKPVKLAPIRPDGSEMRAKTLRRASAYGVPVSTEKDSDVIWVYAPPALDSEGRDEFYGDHACYDWREAFQRVTKYVSDLERAACSKTATSPEAI